MLQGDLFNKALSYQLGIFDGVPDGVNNPSDNDLNDEKTFAGRIFAHPFKDTPLTPVRGLGIGLSGTYGKEKGSVASPNLPSYRTFGQQQFFSYVVGTGDAAMIAEGTAIARGDQSRISPQGYWYWGPFGSMFEYVWSEQEVQRGVVEVVRDSVQADAWQAAASWVLTGEDATYRGVVPAKPLNPLEWSGWGAFQLAARGTQLHVNDKAFDLGFANPARSARKATEFAIGVNWYWNRNVLLVLDYALTTFNGGRQGGDRKKEDVILSRVQFLL
jgi:phosphate-selective porin OprO/OprP